MQQPTYITAVLFCYQIISGQRVCVWGSKWRYTLRVSKFNMLPSILPDSPQTGIPLSLRYKISDSMATIISAERGRNANFPQVLL
jgi:hypothetical protein